MPRPTFLHRAGLLAFFLSLLSLSASGAEELRSRAALAGHTDFVTAVAYSPDGKVLASAGKDGALVLWDAATGKEKATLRAHTDRITALTFSPDGKLLASASFDKTVKLWDPKDGNEIATLREHTHWVNAVAFSPDSKTLATGSSDKTIKLWNVADRKETASLSVGFYAASALAFSPDGKLLAAGSHGGPVQVWNVATRKAQSTLRHRLAVLSLAFAPDGKTLAVATGSLVFTSTVGELHLWDVEAGKLRAELKGHKGGIWCVAYSRDSKRVASASFDGTARLWDAEAGTEIATLEGHKSAVLAVAFSPDGKSLATGSYDRTVRLWDLPAGKLAPGPVWATLREHKPPVVCVTFAPDGKLLASGGDDGKVILWDVPARKVQATLRGHDKAVFFLAFSPDGKLLATAGLDKTVRLWDVPDGKEKMVLRGQTNPVVAVAFSPDGKLLATGNGFDRGATGELKLWDVASGKVVQELTGHKGGITTLAFSPDGKLLGVGSGELGESSEVILWDVALRKVQRRLGGLATNPPTSLSFSADGLTLLAATYEAKVRRWEVATGKLLPSIDGPSGDVLAAAFSPAGKILAIGHDRTVRLWDAGKVEERAALAGHDKMVTALAFTPDGRFLASAGVDGVVRVWNVAVALGGKGIPEGPIVFIKFESKPGRFRILMPGRPKETPRKIRTLAGEINIRETSCVERDGVFQASTIQLPDKVLESDSGEKILRDARARVLGAGGKLVKETEVALGPYRGHELLAETEKGNLLRVRYFFFRRHLYEILVRGPAGLVRSPDVERFFDSFQEIPGEGEAELQLVADMEKALDLKKGGRNDAALRAFEKGLADSVKVFGPRHWFHAPIYGSMAEIHVAERRLNEAEPLYLKAIGFLEKERDPEMIQVVGILRLRLAQLYQMRKDLVRAEPLVQEALRTNPRDATVAPMAKVVLAQIEIARNKDNKAEPLLRESLEALTGKPDPAGIVPTLKVTLAGLLARKGENDKAEILYQEVLEEKTGQALALVGLIDLYLKRGQKDRVLKLAARVEAFVPANASESLLITTGLLRLLSVHAESGDLAAARKMIARATQNMEKRFGPDDDRRALILYRLAEAYLTLIPSLPDAEKLLDQALPVLEKEPAKNPVDLALALRARAMVHLYRGDTARSEALLKRALDVLKENKADPLLQLGLRLHLEQAREVRGRGGEELQELEKDVRAVLARKDVELLVVLPLVFSLADVLMNADKGKDALAVMEDAVRVVEKTPATSPLVLAFLRFNLASLHTRMGRLDRALELSKLASGPLADHLGEDHPFLAYLLQLKGTIHLQRGEADEAEAEWMKCQKILGKTTSKDHPVIAGLLSEMAVLSTRRKDWDRAAARLQDARRIACRHIHLVLPAYSEAEQLGYLEGIEQPQYHTALSLAVNQLEDEKLTGLAAGWVLNGKGVALRVLADRQVLARQSMDPEIGKRVREWQAVRNEIAGLTFVTPGPRRGKEHGERLRTLHTRLGELDRELGGQAPRSGADPWVEVDKVRSVLAKDAVLVEMARVKVRNFRYNPGGKEDEKYPWQPDHYVAWVIPATGEGRVRTVDLGPAREIDNAVRSFRAAIKEAPRKITGFKERSAEKIIQEELTKLADLVLEPLLPHLKAKKTWIISPDSELWLIPWGALPVGEKTYAIEKYRIHHLTSGRDLVAPVPKVKTGPPLVMTNPEYDLDFAESLRITRRMLRQPPPEMVERREKWPSQVPVPRNWVALAGTARETDAILAHLTRYSGARPAVYKGKEALEGIFRAAERPDVVVLSTHGFFLEPKHVTTPMPDLASLRGQRGSPGEVPGLDSFEEMELTNAATGEKIRFRDLKLMLEHPALLGGLVLAGANKRGQGDPSGEDGILTAWEIAGVDLRGTRLVVLSACETALGRVEASAIHGASVAGLRQAFVVAGARNVVATLWQVPDEESADLMAGFFKRLADGLSVTDALGDAQREMITARRKTGKAAHPLYWAAFALTGPGR